MFYTDPTSTQDHAGSSNPMTEDIHVHLHVASTYTKTVQIKILGQNSLYVQIINFIYISIYQVTNKCDTEF